MDARIVSDTLGNVIPVVLTLVLPQVQQLVEVVSLVDLLLAILLEAHRLGSGQLRTDVDQGLADALFHHEARRRDLMLFDEVSTDRMD
jgi:hypothetical protein